MLTDKKVSSNYNSFGAQKMNSLSYYCTYGVPFLYILLLALCVFNYLTMTRVKVLETEVENLKQTLFNLKEFDDNLIRDIIGFDDEEDIEAYDFDQDPTTVISPEGNDDTDYEIFYKKTNNNDTKLDEDSYTNLLRKLTGLDATQSQTEDGRESVRQKRNIVAATDDGVIINSESYLEKKAKNVSSRYNIRGSSITPYPARPSSAGTQWPMYPYRYSTAAYHRNLRPTKPTKAPDVYVRTSRVKHFEDKSKAFRQKVKVADLKSLDSYIDSNEETTTYSPQITIVRNTGYRRRSIKHLPSVHYNGDTSKYVLGVHDNFYGNDQLRHLNDVFVDWKPTDWVDTLRMHSHFTMANGYVTVKQTGLYLIYAQIYYMDTHDTVGYKIFKNDKVILQCTVTSPPIPGARMKGNTCFTGGVEHFRAGDRLSLSDIDQRLSLFADGKSFFGLIKLGNISL